MPPNQPSVIAFDQDESSDQAPDRPEQLSLRVAQAIADAAGSSCDKLEPLYHSIDPEALDRLFAPTNSGTARSDGQVQFAYSDYEIVIQSTGEVSVTAIDTPADQCQR